MSLKSHTHVIIVGAGPVGLVAANLLVDEGIKVTLVEALNDVPRDLRASTFHPPTLDMLDERFGVVGSMIEQGLICPEWQFRDRKQGAIATFELSRLLPDTKHPYRLQCEQWRLGEMLFARLQQKPLCEIRLDTRATEARQTAGGVELDVMTGSGKSETLKGDYLIGSDGIGSVVRRAIGAEFEGITIPELFLTITSTYDFSEAMPDIANIAYLSDPSEWFVLIRTKSMWRAMFPVDAALEDKDVTSEPRVRALLDGAINKDVPYEVKHRTAYRVHERVASHYARGRIMIAGDAAHVNNPLGGMGLNGGIHDAFNLCEKLIKVIDGAPLELMERYSRQRRKVALDVVQQTTLRNRAILNTREPEARQAYYDDLRRIVADPVKHREYVMRTSMIQSLRDVQNIE